MCVQRCTSVCTLKFYKLKKSEPNIINVYIFWNYHKSARVCKIQLISKAWCNLKVVMARLQCTWWSCAYQCVKSRAYWYNFVPYNVYQYVNFHLDWYPYTIMIHVCYININWGIFHKKLLHRNLLNNNVHQKQFVYQQRYTSIFLKTVEVVISSVVNVLVE